MSRVQVAPGQEFGLMMGVGPGQDMRIVNGVSGQGMRMVKADARQEVGMVNVGARRNLGVMTVGVRHNLDIMRVRARHNLDIIEVGARHNLDIVRAVTGQHIWECVRLWRDEKEKGGQDEKALGSRKEGRRQGYGQPRCLNLGFEDAKQREKYGHGCCTEGKKIEEVE
jgi:hypothetical protein